MSEGPAASKRARLFRGDFRLIAGLGVVFPLDTCRQDLPLHLLESRIPLDDHGNASIDASAPSGKGQTWTLKPGHHAPDRGQIAGPAARVDGIGGGGNDVGQLPPPAGRVVESQAPLGPAGGGYVDDSNLKFGRNLNPTGPSPRSSEEPERQDSPICRPRMLVGGSDEDAEGITHVAQIVPHERHVRFGVGKGVPPPPQVRTRNGDLVGESVQPAKALERPLIGAAQAAGQISQVGAPADMRVLANEEGGNAVSTPTLTLTPPSSKVDSTITCPKHVAGGGSGRGGTACDQSEHEALSSTPATITTNDLSTLGEGQVGGEPVKDDSASPTQERGQTPATERATAAVSMVASFLTQPAVGTQSLSPSIRMPSPSSKLDKRYPCSGSPPTTPTQLSTLVSGVPTSGGSAGNYECAGRGRGHRIPIDDEDRIVSSLSTTRAGAATPASVGGSPASHATARKSRFCNMEWPMRVKERRRIINFPKRSEPAGTRILYWVRGCFRVRDNFALSVAMWLSRELQMPLHAVAFVDPAIGSVASSSNAFAGQQAQQKRQSPGVRGHDEIFSLSFRMAVEASALCEMEKSLRALTVPLVALACIESEIPAALAHWCGCSAQVDGHALPAAATRTSPGVTSAASAEEVAALASRFQGSVHIAITDECYHPRQLWLAEMAGKALPGVALYTVDSCSCYPVNTFYGERAATAAADKTAASKEEYRQAQDSVLEQVCTDLAYRPRLPLEARLQAPVFVEGVNSRASLPRMLATDGRGSGTLTFAQIDWDALRALSMERFPSFGKPFSYTTHSGTKEDVIAVMGGGERAAEVILRQTLATALAQGIAENDEERTGTGTSNVVHDEVTAGVESEISGRGFGGALLHFMRLGSLSPICVVQALLNRPEDELERQDRGARASKLRTRLLGAVLDREYLLYRSYFSYQREGRACVLAAAEGSGHRPRGQKVWQVKDWQPCIPRWVWEELQKGQRDPREELHTPEEIKHAGSTVPSSIDDPLFSAIQVRLTRGGRLHPLLAPYWARSIVRMMLIPSQAVALILALVEEFALGASYAGDIVPGLLADAFDALKDPPAPCLTSPTTKYTSYSSAELLPGLRTTSPIFRGLSVPLVASREGVQSVLGGAEALARFIRSPSPP